MNHSAGLNSGFLSPLMLHIKISLTYYMLTLEYLCARNIVLYRLRWKLGYGWQNSEMLTDAGGRLDL